MKKLINWIFTKKQETTQAEPCFELCDVKAKRYDDFIRYMDRQQHWRNERG